MPAAGAAGVQAQLLLQLVVRPAGMEPLDVDPVGNHANLFCRTAFVLGQVAAVRFGHGDERVGQRRQQPVGQLDVVGQAGRVQRRADHRHAGQPSRPGGPKTSCRRRCLRSPRHRFAAGATAAPAARARPRHICRPAPGEGGNLRGQHLAQRVEVFQTAQFRQEPPAVHAADDFHQERFRPADRHARMTNITRSGPRSASGVSFRRRRNMIVVSG